MISAFCKSDVRLSENQTLSLGFLISESEHSSTNQQQTQNYWKELTWRLLEIWQTSWRSCFIPFVCCGVGVDLLSAFLGADLSSDTGWQWTGRCTWQGWPRMRNGCWGCGWNIPGTPWVHHRAPLKTTSPLALCSFVETAKQKSRRSWKGEHFVRLRTGSLGHFWRGTGLAHSNREFWELFQSVRRWQSHIWKETEKKQQIAENLKLENLVRVLCLWPFIEMKESFLFIDTPCSTTSWCIWEEYKRTYFITGVWQCRYNVGATSRDTWHHWTQCICRCRVACFLPSWFPRQNVTHTTQHNVLWCHHCSRLSVTCFPHHPNSENCLPLYQLVRCHYWIIWP